MNAIVPDTDPLGLPVPASILFGLKVFGFFLHMIFMNLWAAGLPAAIVLLKFWPKAAQRLLKAMPFFMAFGINAGIVPLLFLQTLYPHFFYPATILQAWFWFLIIPLLLIAYYAVYVAAFGRYQLWAALLASVLLTWIGLSFSSAMSLTALPAKWPAIFYASADAGSVDGFYFHWDSEVILRYLMVLGMAFGTLAVFFLVDREWFARDPQYRDQAKGLVRLYGLGLVVYGSAGLLYAEKVSPDLLGYFWRSLTAISMVAGTLLALGYAKRGGRSMGLALLLVHMVVLLSNVIARQIVQYRELQKWVDVEKIPVRGEWGSFFLFVIVLVSAVGILVWIARTTMRALAARRD